VNRNEYIGVIAVGVLAAFLISFAIGLVVMQRDLQSKRVEYEECLENIAEYLDATETLYQIEECRLGVRAP